MWNWNKYKILYCEWCFTFWFSVMFATVNYFIEYNYYYALIPFLVTSLNYYVNGFIQRH